MDDKEIQKLTGQEPAGASLEDALIPDHICGCGSGLPGANPNHVCCGKHRKSVLKDIPELPSLKGLG